jgi:hypothetical protein
MLISGKSGSKSLDSKPSTNIEVQTLSLPISTIGAVAGAAKIAHGISQGIARGVSDAIGFHEVLNEAPSENAAVAADDLVEKIRERLSESGIGVNQDLPIRITDDGQLRIEGKHEQAAEIESILNSDDQIVQLAKQLATTDHASGLTIRAGQENIQNSPGGYPNW